ncbi:MAG: cytochrome c [bacterium]
MNKRQVGLCLIGGLLLAAGLYVGGKLFIGSSNKAVEPAGKDSSVSSRFTLRKGRRLYRTHCSTCHGTSGRGDGPASEYLTRVPLNFHSDTAANYSRKQLFRKVSEGNPRTGMPSWSGTLSVAERKAIVRFLLETFINPGGSR